MTVTINGTTGITTPAVDSEAKFAKADMPTGSVLQVVSATLATSFSTTSTSAVNVTGFAASITPSSSTSKILVIVSSRTSHSSGGFINTRGAHWLYRGASNLCSQFTGSYLGGMSATDINQYHSSVISYLDSPATTSLVTYQIKASSDSPSNTMSTIGGDSTITLIEIAA